MAPSGAIHSTSGPIRANIVPADQGGVKWGSFRAEHGIIPVLAGCPPIGAGLFFIAPAIDP